MKLNKTVLAVAIAGIAAAPMMASATTKLSGQVQVKIAGDNGDNGGTIAAGDVDFGIYGEQALNNGLTGYGNLHLGLNSLGGGPGADTQGNESVKVGVKGGFGDLSIGSVGNAGTYGQLSDSLYDPFAGFSAGGIMYSGSFGGATVGVSYSPKRNVNSIAAGVKFAYNGLSIGLGAQNVMGDAEATHYSAKVGFAFAGASVGLGYQGSDAPEDSAIHAKVGYSISGVSLSATYAMVTESEDSKISLSASYGLGGGMTASAGASSTSFGSGADNASDWNLKLAKSF